MDYRLILKCTYDDKSISNPIKVSTKRDCVPACLEKRDFMEHDPPRSSSDFYKDYDPMIGIGTAVVLLLFFFIITIRSFVRWAVQKVQFINFEKKRRKEGKLMGATTPVVNV